MLTKVLVGLASDTSSHISRHHDSPVIGVAPFQCPAETRLCARTSSCSRRDDHPGVPNRLIFDRVPNGRGHHRPGAGVITSPSARHLLEVGDRRGTVGTVDRAANSIWPTHGPTLSAVGRRRSKRLT